MRVRVFDVGNETSRTRNIHAPAGRSFTEEGVQQVLDSIVEQLEKQRPGLEYRLVELSPSSFNFIVESEEAVVSTDNLAEAACL